MNLLDYAKQELTIAGFYDQPDNISEGFDYNNEIKDAVLEIIKVFADQGHSGMSANIVLSILQKLMSYKPLSPLSGEDSEWFEIDTDKLRPDEDWLQQNKRCFHVFRNKNGAYDGDGIIFEEPDGSRFTSSDSRIKVVFPYTPESKVVKVDYRKS